MPKHRRRGRRMVEIKNCAWVPVGPCQTLAHGVQCKEDLFTSKPIRERARHRLSQSGPGDGLEKEEKEI